LFAVFVTGAIAFTVAMPVRAGDVTVTVGGGTLKLKGSAEADDVTIDNRGGAVGLRVTPGAGTTLNGVAGEQVFGGATGGIKAALGDGADVFVVDDLIVPGALTVATGKGSDRVRVIFSIIREKAKIDLGAGNNALEVCDSTFDGSLAAKAGAPVDEIVTAQCPGGVSSLISPSGSIAILEEVLVSGDLSFKTAKGLDGLGVRRATIVGDAKIALGGGVNGFGTCDADYRGNLTIAMAGKDEGIASLVCEGTDFIVQAEGDGAIGIADVSIAGRLKIKTGKGGDGVVIIDTSMGSAKIDVGAGLNFAALTVSSTEGNLDVKGGKHADQLQIDGFGAMGDAKLTLGAGDNELITKGSTVAGDLTVKAGNGNDTLHTSGITVGGTRTVKGGGGMDTID